MPYASDRQRRFLHARHPDIAARWDKEYGGKVHRKKNRVSKSMDLIDINKALKTWRY